MKCPRCENELEATNVEELGITINAHMCPTCRGTWVGSETLKDIESTVDQRFVEFRRIPSKSVQMKELHCPQCPGPVKMDKVESQRDKKVVLDVCPQCRNIWLDAGEKEAIQQDSFLNLLVDTFRFSR